MTGDVLPCFDASTLVIPEDASCIITVPITLDVASNHGVIVASNTGILTESYTVSLVENLLQKPSLEELVANEALLDDGRTLLDTGIIAARGKAWAELARLASSCEPMIEELLKSRKEDDLLFLHLGTSSEVLDHLSGASSELVGEDICVPSQPQLHLILQHLLGIQIGSLSVVVGINVPRDIGGMADDSFRFMLPDRVIVFGRFL
ncbi:L-FUCOSE KINASE [Salix viminalis]|uniref:L-FUCOSE KINASE n=1 Tax=Salix viminalis TaxID=40686 RepID=A0A9Q0NSL9_SALVM|nr:L-FUCOSE KINASE [Salix viminalis]